MKLNLLYTSLCALALAGTACTDESDYPQADFECQSLEVYFYPASATSFTLGEGDTEVTVDVFRSSTEGAQTYTLKAESEHLSLFTVPSSITFAENEDETSFKVNFRAEDFPPMEEVALTFIVGEGENTPYAYQRITDTFLYEPWIDVVGENGEKFGTYVEDCMTAWFSFTPNPNPSWPIRIQRSPAINGLYRIVNCYEKFPIDGTYVGTTDNYLYFNVSDPSMVYLCNAQGKPNDGANPVIFNTQVDLGYGNVYITGDFNFEYADGNLKPELAGTFTNGVVKFPQKALLAAMANYKDAAFYYANNNGKFRIIFPGVVEEEEPEPDTSWESIGKGMYTDVLITPLFAEDENSPTSYTYEVEVEQNSENPNMYRIVNPYKDGVFPGGLNYDGDRYFVFDATNPDCVLVPEQEIFNIDIPQIGGEVIAMNVAYNLAYEYDAATIIAGGYADTFKNNVFEFAPGHLRLYFPNTNVENWVDKLIYFSDDASSLVLSGEATQNAAAKSRAFNFNRSLNAIPEPVGMTPRESQKLVFPASKRMEIKY